VTGVLAPPPPLPLAQAAAELPPEAALAGAALVAFAAGLIFGLLARSRQAAAGSLLLSGDAVAFAFNPSENSFELIPVRQVAENTYVGAGGRAILLVPRTVVARPIKRLGKPAFLAVSLGWGTAAVDPRALGSLGLASLALRAEGGTWDAREGGGRLVAALLSGASEAVGEITINPELRLVVAYDVPRVVREYLATMLDNAIAATYTTLHTLRASERIHRLWLERERARSALAEAVGRWLFWLIIAAAVGFFVVALLGRVAPP
jgi:hypothetical protein